MESSIDVLFAIRNYFETEETVSRKSFADFTRHWVENPEIQALEWIPKVTHEQRVIMEEQAQNDGFTDFRFTEKDAQLKTIEAGDRNYYFPVYYVEPYVGNEAALGFDLASHPVRKEALLRACRKETPTATTGIRLILSDRTDFGFLVYLPIDLHVPRGDDDCNVSGFALGIYRIEDLVNTAVAMLDLDDMILRIDDEANDRPLYFRGSDGNTHSDKQQITASMKEAAHITGTETLEVAGLRWHLRFWLTKARLGANQSWSSWSVLVGGFLFTSLLGVLLLHALNRTTEIERLVTERTSALLDTNRALEGEILDRRKAETELVKARDAAQQAAEAKSMFLANMSHEIRTPLNGVIGMNRMLLESELDDDQRELAGTVDTSARSLLNLINDILDFSKIEAGKLEFENIPFDLEVALEEIIDLLHGEVASKGLKLSYHLDEEVPLQLCGDPGRLRQVLLNLLNNAIKFTRIGGVHISISLLKDSLKYALIQFAVRDTGIGIPCNRMNRLFRSFSQVDGSTTRQFGGTGLGLAISRELVERMGGHIEVKSEPDVGSTFTFVVKLDKHEGKPRSVPLKKCGKLVHPHYDGRVLVVEDNIVNQKVAVRMLEKVSLRADVAANGEEAVKAARAINYDLVFMDCQMPRMDGYEATRQLRQTHGKDQLVIVAMTANAMKGDRERCLASGMNDYISKPVRLEELYQILGKWLSHRTREAAVKS